MYLYIILCKKKNRKIHQAYVFYVVRTLFTGIWLSLLNIYSNNWCVKPIFAWQMNIFFQEIASMLISFDRQGEWLSKEVKIRWVKFICFILERFTETTSNQILVLNRVTIEVQSRWHSLWMSHCHNLEIIT